MLSEVFAGRGTSIFEVMSQLAKEHGSINLGQGFPDQDGPSAILAAAARRIEAGPNQYPPMMGVPELRQAVADCNRRFWGLEVDWRSQVLVTSGATEALADCFFALIRPGDEAVLIEPFYDSYLPILERAGAVVRTVALEPPHWRLGADALAAAFSDRTKLIVLNNPNNPAAKVFDQAELALIAGLLDRHDALAVCDEVYEHIVFSQPGHRPLLAIPGMAERAVRIGSAGKTFSLTGWKVGYLTGPEALVQAIAKAHQFITFTTPPALQYAVAEGLMAPDAYYDGLLAGMRAKRDLFAGKLAAAGFEVLPCAGTYFLNVDIRSIGYADDDVAFCRAITEEAGVTAIPMSAFYAPGSADPPRHLARFCFAKRDEVLTEAADRLTAFAGTLA
jgi:aspartate/methionine/tyrosine aminotransferase